MKILVVSATDEEIKHLKEINSHGKRVDFLTAGAGMIATTHSLTRHLIENHYDLALNCGIAGSFDRNIPIGESVSVSEDTFSELGAQDGPDFLTMDEIGLKNMTTTRKSFSSPAIEKLNLLNVRGITVNSVHGEESSIEKIKRRLNPQVESMEGAAFFYVCDKEKIPALQIRTISNYVERRNKTAWNIPLALSSLRAILEKIISVI